MLKQYEKDIYNTFFGSEPYNVDQSYILNYAHYPNKSLFSNLHFQIFVGDTIENNFIYNKEISRKHFVNEIINLLEVSDEEIYSCKNDKYFKMDTYIGEGSFNSYGKDIRDLILS